LYLLILESIGTSELLLIGLIALIIFGPRKLPQMARTIGKTVAEFKRAGQEFKTTWEKEVNLEEEKTFFKDPLDENLIIAETKYSETSTLTETKILQPEIKEISQADFHQPQPAAEMIQAERKADSQTSKQDWL
jgi:Tat protein translocase TatB subunit